MEDVDGISNLPPKSSLRTREGGDPCTDSANDRPSGARPNVTALADPLKGR